MEKTKQSGFSHWGVGAGLGEWGTDVPEYRMVVAYLPGCQFYLTLLNVK